MAKAPRKLTSGNHRIKNDLVFEEPIMLDGTQITPINGAKVRFEQGFIANPMQQCFDVSAGGQFSFAVGTQDFITPQYFGANGLMKTNQTAEVQASVDAATEAQTEAYFPPGRYLIDRLRAEAPTRLRGAGRHKSILWASPRAKGAFIEDTGNAVGFCMNELGVYGQPDSKLTDVIKLGFNKYPWGSGSVLENLHLYDFPEAVGLHLNQNISKLSNITTQNCKTGIRAIGNGLHIQHVQICASREVSVDLESPARIYDMEIEAPLGETVLRIGPACQAHIFGLHISLSQRVETLIEWHSHQGLLHGNRVDLGPNGSFGKFMRGRLEIEKPTDVHFDPIFILDRDL